MTSQQSVDIKVSGRKPGKGSSRTLRSSKLVPAVVYGPKTGNLPFCLSEVEADRYSKHKFDNIIFTLKSDDPKLNNLKVLRKDFAVHPLSRRPIHFDFYAIDLTQEVTIKVELRFDGKPIGAAAGGVFNVIRRDVEIRCLPGNIPDSIPVDVSGLALGESIHVADLKLPPDITIITDGSDTLATCAVVKEETAPAAAVGATEAAAGAVPAAGGAAAAPAGGAGSSQAGDKKG
jgi:large subunit ribosomal protein L25